MNPPDQRPVAGRHRVWRALFILYAIVLTIATHWPHLALGPEMPATDKQIHTFAFALATFLLWMTRWQPRLTITAAMSLAWAGVDELTQAIPIIQRTCSWLDFLANVLGVALATLLIWTLSRLRSSR